MNNEPFDIGPPPPEPPAEVAPKSEPAESFREKCLRRAQEAEAFQKAAAEALEGFGTMVPPWALKHYQDLADSALGWYVELAGDDVERPS